eukprot:scaffold3156_cov268-Chaetoceros_neogracile.AAC.7
MAPNNSLCASVHSMSALDLSAHFSSKYPPLAPVRLSQEEASLAVSCDSIVSNLLADASPLGGIDIDNHALIGNKKDDDYWNMPCDEEPDYFSADYMETMLTHDAKRRSSDTNATIAAAGTEMYWDWSENDTEDDVTHKSSLIAKILEEDLIRQMLTSQSVSNNEVQYHGSKDTTTPTIDRDCSPHDHDSFDYFYTPPHEPSREDVIDFIMKFERARQAVMTETIVSNLIQQGAVEESEMKIVSNNDTSCNTNYWEW